MNPPGTNKGHHFIKSDPKFSVRVHVVCCLPSLHIYSPLPLLPPPHPCTHASPTSLFIRHICPPAFGLLHRPAPGRLCSPPRGQLLQLSAPMSPSRETRPTPIYSGTPPPCSGRSFPRSGVSHHTHHLLHYDPMDLRHFSLLQGRDPTRFCLLLVPGTCHAPPVPVAR